MNRLTNIFIISLLLISSCGKSQAEIEQEKIDALASKKNKEEQRYYVAYAKIQIKSIHMRNQAKTFIPKLLTYACFVKKTNMQVQIKTTSVFYGRTKWL